MAKGKLLVYNSQAVGTPSGACAIDNLVAENIRSGVNVGGVVGTMEAGTGNPFSSAKMITFYDEYGYPKLYIPVTSLPLSSLPTLPTLEWYDCVWDRTLEQVNAMTNGGRVCCKVNAKSNAPTIIYPNEMGWYAGSFQMYCCASGSFTLNVDWGDGSATETFSLTGNGQTISHTFSSVSHNPISIRGNKEWSIGYNRGGGSTTSVNAFGQRNRLEKVHLGIYGRVGNRAFYNSTLTKILGEVSTGGNECFAHSCLSAINLSTNVLSSLSLSIYNFGWLSLDILIVPNNYVSVSTFDDIAQHCRIGKIRIDRDTPWTTASTMLQRCYSAGIIIEIPKGSKDTYLANSTWATYINAGLVQEGEY